MGSTTKSGSSTMVSSLARTDSAMGKRVLKEEGVTRTGSAQAAVHLIR